MAVQIDTEELKGCKSYFSWIFEQIKPSEESEILRCAQNDAQNDAEEKRLEDLCRFLFEADYIWEVDEDGIRAKDAADIRKVYAEKVGAENGKNEREIDRIWKSVHGKCSALELILSMCVRLDEMVNEGEEGSMVPDFFRILSGNIGFDRGKAASEADWKAALDRFMKREYEADGNGGGLFPLKKWSEGTSKDQRKVSIWYQMNAWLDENLDEDEHFMMENCG